MTIRQVLEIGKNKLYVVLDMVYDFDPQFSPSEVRLTPQRDEGMTTDTKVSDQREQRHKADEINEQKMKK